MTEPAGRDHLSEPQYWITPEELRDIAASGMAGKADYILQHCFDQNGEVSLRRLEDSEREVVKRYQDMKGYLEKALLFIGAPLSGRVVDLGAGTGTLTSIISRFKAVRQVCSVEISEAYVNRIMPLVFQATKADISKIERSIGDFDQLKLDDNSVDFIVEYGSFHHSSDIEKTLKEAARILKKDGWFIGIERARPNHLTNKDIDRLLAIEFAAPLKRMYGIAEDRTVTRRDWGEHELRYCDWNHLFSKQGFRTYVVPFVRLSGISKILAVFYHLFGNVMLRRRMTAIPYATWFCDRKYVKTLILAQKS